MATDMDIRPIMAHATTMPDPSITVRAITGGTGVITTRTITGEVALAGGFEHWDYSYPAGLSDCVPTKEPFASDIDGREQLIRLESAVPIFVPKLGCDALLIIGNRD